MKYPKLREQAFIANRQLQQYGLVIATFGNASAYDPENKVFAIKPSGVDYSKLTVEDMVIVNLEGEVVDGTLNPSSDTQTHAVLYKEWPGIRGVVHTHSTYATAWAQSHLPIPILGTTHADHLVSDIPCAPVMDEDMIKGNYEYMTGYQIIHHLKEINQTPSEVEMILVAGHAPFTWGNSVRKAVYNSLICEEIAKMAYLTLQIRPNIDRLDAHLIQKHYERKHGEGAYYGQVLNE